MLLKRTLESWYEQGRDSCDVEDYIWATRQQQLAHHSKITVSIDAIAKWSGSIIAARLEKADARHKLLGTHPMLWESN